MGCVLVIGSNIAYSQIVLCSIPYEQDCSYGDDFSTCSFNPCEPTGDPGDPFTCEDGEQEEDRMQQPDGTPKQWHDGLLTVEEPHIPGNTEWVVGETVCSKTRKCLIGFDCEPKDGGHWCKKDESATWTEHKETFLTPVENTECEVLEEEQGGGGEGCIASDESGVLG